MTQGIHSGPPREAAGDCCEQSDPGLVARTDFGMAEDPVSRRREDARVPRDDLPQRVHPSAGVLKKELIQHLRSKRRIRRLRHSRASGRRSGQIVDAISIRERPAEIEDRANPGHWGAICWVAHNGSRTIWKKLVNLLYAKHGKPLRDFERSLTLEKPTSEKNIWRGLSRFCLRL